MNNGRTAAVMMLMAAMLVGMIGVAPAAPITNASPDVATSSSTYTQVLQDWVEYLDESRTSNKLDSALTSFKDSGNVPLNVAVDSEGKASVLIAIANGADIEGLKNIVSVNWMMDFKAATVVSAYANRAALSQLESYTGVAAVVSDYLYEARTEGMESRPSNDVIGDEADMYMSKSWIGANDVWTDYGFDGNGVVVGVADTGADFSHPDLKDAYYYDPFDGSPGSFDPSGYGMIWTGYRINATVLENSTRFMAASGYNKLSFGEEGKYYISDFDPLLHDRGNLNNLDSFYYETYLSAWWGGTYPNEANLTEFYYDVLRQPIELPAPSLTAGSTYSYTYYVNGTPHTQAVPVYFHGWLFQQRNVPYMKTFAPLIVLNGTYLVVDWDTARAYTEFWNYNINYGLFDFNETSSWTYFENIGDWSFADDWAAGEWYSAKGGVSGVDHLVLAHDYTGDSIDDFGLGAICNGVQNVFGGVVPIIPGSTLGGRMWTVLYDTDAHGTFVSGQIAGRGTLQYPVGLNYTSERLYGIANGSKIINEMAIGTGSHLGANIWEAGFDLSGGYFVWNPTSNHSAVVSSNSWGWIAPSYYELWPLYSLMYAALSTPGYFAPAYPGILYCFSAGNEGPGYGTMTPPNVAQILHVGATTAHHTFQNSYGPNQGWDQIAEFSSRGGTSVGYPKPDVCAPGRSVYGIVPQYAAFLLSLVGYTASAPAYAGTSMSCPQVAGVVALMYEADASLAPDEAKVIIQNTALDLGLDPLIQGHGRVDAYAAIEYVQGDAGMVFSTYDSTVNYAAAVAQAWDYWLTPYATGDIFINDTAMPTDFADGSLYYGVVDPGDVVPLTMTGTYWDAGAVAAGDFTWQSMHYAVDNVWTDTWLTYTYLENTSSAPASVKRGGWFNLTAEMDTFSYDNFRDAPFATLYVSGPASLNGQLWAFVFDWSDTSPANGVPDYYNRFTTLGDELTRIQYGGDMAVFKTDLSSASGIGDLFPNTPIVLVNDGSPVVTGGHNIAVTITTWKLVDDGEIEIGDNVAGGLWANLTVPAGADPGVHAGFVVVGGDFKIPYSYVVRSVVDTSNGEEVDVASGFGDELNPYENGASFEEQNADYDFSGDFHTFIVHVANSSAAYMGARVDWANAGSDFDVSIVTMYGYELALSETGVGGAGASAIAPITAPGDFIVQVRTYALGGPQPTNFTLKVVCWEAIPEPTLTLSWYSRDHPTQTVLTAGGTASGDHVVLNATWTDAVLPGMPDYQITTTEMKVLRGLLSIQTGDLVPPTAGYNPFAGPIQLDEFGWVFVPGIEEGDNVRVSVDFSNGDCDVMGWWAGTDNTTWTYGNNLLADQMATGAKPEVGSFIAGRDGTLAIGVFDYDGSTGTFEVTVDTRAGLEPAAVDGKTFELDTYPLGTNGVFAVAIASDTGTNVKFSLEFAGITLINYFAPELSNIAVSGAGAVKTITWDVSDVNADDTHTFEVLLSADDGVTWQLLDKDLTAHTYSWDSTGFYTRSYKVEVRVADSYGLTDSIISEPFNGGTINTVTETTTTTTTTTTATGIEILYIGLIGGIGVGVVIVLILFLVRKK